MLCYTMDTYLPSRDGNGCGIGSEAASGASATRGEGASDGEMHAGLPTHATDSVVVAERGRRPYFPFRKLLERKTRTQTHVERIHV